MKCLIQRDKFGRVKSAKTESGQESELFKKAASQPFVNSMEEGADMIALANTWITKISTSPEHRYITGEPKAFYKTPQGLTESYREALTTSAGNAVEFGFIDRKGEILPVTTIVPTLNNDSPIGIINNAIVNNQLKDSKEFDGMGYALKGAGQSLMESQVSANQVFTELSAIPGNNISVFPNGTLRAPYPVVTLPEVETTEGTGKSTQEFFGNVVTGGDVRYEPSRPYEYEETFTIGSQVRFQQRYDQKMGNFDQHIATSIPTFRETQIKKGAAIVRMFKKAPEVVNNALKTLKDTYQESTGIKSSPTFIPVDSKKFKELAEYHTSVSDDRNNEVMKRSYRKFLDETLQQFNFLLSKGYDLRPYLGKGEPYGVNSNLIREDLKNNNRLFYLMSRSATGEGNENESSENYMPFEETGIVIDGQPVLYNDAFRAVHDVFGHGMVNNSFSAQGELDAYQTHKTMYSKEAQKALFLETVMYNAYYQSNKNYAPRKIYDIPQEFMDFFDEGPVVYDLGGSEGSWVKTITEESNGNIKTINLDPSPEMQASFNNNKPENSEMYLEAFYQGWDDVKAHEPKEKADVVHESMMFQFIDNNGERADYIREVKDKYLKEGGLFITEEKFQMNSQQEYLVNESLKTPHKDKYYTKDQQSLKADQVLVGMKENQANYSQYIAELKEQFKFVQPYWFSGNFRGIVATDNKEDLDTFLEEVGTTSNPAYTFSPTIEAISSSIDLQNQREKFNRELQEIENKAIEDGSFMMAPNGKKTNLTEREWLTTRHPSFINWFGDFINDPKNASKVVDENGDPRKVYHGSGNMGFHIFNISDVKDGGHFFAGSIQMARSYTPNNVSTRYDVATTAAEAIDFVEYAGGSVEIEQEDGETSYIVFNEEGREEGTATTEEELINLVNTTEFNTAGVGSFFLNLRDPGIIDGYGDNWDDIKGAESADLEVTLNYDNDSDQYNVKDYDGTISTYPTFEEAIDYIEDKYDDYAAEQVASNYEDEGEGYYKYSGDIRTGEEAPPGQTTREWVNEVKDWDADGVVFNDIDDNGPHGYSGSGDVFVAFNSTDIKATDNVGQFDVQNEDVRFSIIGERGAAQLYDAEIIMDNNRIAKEMEEDGKDPSVIRLATGWEKGEDGKWRYEIEDFNLKDDVIKVLNDEYLNKSNPQFSEKLEWVLQGNELLKVYPELGKVRLLAYTDKDNDLGSYSSEQKAIRINTNDLDKFNSVLLHEIQHAIQHIEGFAQGGNPEMFHNKEYKVLVSKDILPLVSTIEADLTKTQDDLLEANNSPVSKLTEIAKKYGIPKADNSLVRRIEFKIDKLNKLLNSLTDIDLTPEQRLNAYQRLAGEVEARNVQRRVSMSPEERLNTLLQETEDIPREEQIQILRALNKNEMKKASSSETQVSEIASAGFLVPEIGTQTNPEATIDVESLKARAEITGDVPVVSINEFEGIPMMFGISDELTTGDVINPTTGNTISNLHGGLGFNSTSLHKDYHWANIDRAGAATQLEIANKIYNTNKELFEKVWQEGKIPNGQIPVAIAKMSEGAIDSNEAVMRVALDTLTAFKPFNLKKNQKKLVSAILADLDTKDTQELFKHVSNENYTNASDIITDIVSHRDSTGKEYSLKDLSFVNKILVNSNSKFREELTNLGFTERLNIASVRNIIKDPAFNKVNTRDIISIVGIDVINPEIKKTNHPHYPWGLNGGLIGILSNPTNLVDVFPTMRSSVINQLKDNKKLENALAWGVPTGMGLSNINFRGDKVSTEMSEEELLAGFLRLALPGVNFNLNQASWDLAINNPNVQRFVSQNGQIEGFTDGQSIFVNPQLKSNKVLLHEAGHIWGDYMRSHSKESKKLWDRGLELTEGTKELENAQKIYGDTDLAKEEALMELIASKGNTILEAQKKSKLEQWLSDVWSFITSNFKSSGDLLKSKTIDTITLDDFLGAAVYDLLSGEKLTDSVGAYSSVWKDKSNNDARASFQENPFNNPGTHPRKPNFKYVKVGNTGVAYSENDGLITLAMIETPIKNRKSGEATAAMNQLIAYADANGKSIDLFVSPRDRATTEQQLFNFYERFGFRQKYGGIEQEMIRNPRKPRFSVVQSNFDPNTNSVEEFKDLIQNGTWGMLTGENPDAKQLDEESNIEANDQARSWLTSRGYNPLPIKGKYGNEENSFLVEGMTQRDALDFAIEFKQDSVATDKGLIYRDATYNPIQKGNETFGQTYEDYYSTISIQGQDISYTVDYTDERLPINPSTSGSSDSLIRKVIGTLGSQGDINLSCQL